MAATIYDLLPYATFNVDSIFDMSTVVELDSVGTTSVKWRDGVTDEQVVAAQRFLLDEHGDLTGNRTYGPLTEMTIRHPDTSNFNSMARFSKLLK